jgi:hypothetical protein
VITVSLVRYGRKWEINSRADYDAAMKELDDNEFCANMCDDYSRTLCEIAEVNAQRRAINKIAREKGII